MQAVKSALTSISESLDWGMERSCDSGGGGFSPFAARGASSPPSAVRSIVILVESQLELGAPLSGGG